MPHPVRSRYPVFFLSSAAALLLVVLLTAAITLRAGPAGQAAPAPLPVAVLPFMEQQSYRETLRLSGLVQAKARAQLAFEIPGLLLALEVEEGTTVKAGQALGQLDTRQLQAQRDMAAAELASIDAELQLAQLRLERSGRLRETGAVSVQEYDETRLTAEALASRRSALLARLKTLDINLEKSALRAPYDGVVAARHMDPGTVLQAGEPVLQLVSVDHLEARIGIPASHFDAVLLGQHYPLQLHSGDISAPLRALRRDLDTRTHTALAVFDLPPAAMARDGETVSLILERTVRARGGWVPISALLEGERGAWTVLRISEQGDGAQLALREAVEVLSVDDNRAFVRGSLRDGQSVVADGVHRIAAGTAVHALER